MRAIWSGAISFGLVNIPVKLYSASGSNKLRFTLLAKSDFSKVQYKKVAESDGRELSQDEIARGYEFAKGKFVVINDKDFQKVDQSATSTIEIVCFVKEDEIAPLFYKKPYYLEPVSPSSKPYSLLREALARSGKVGLAKFIMRNREYLGVLKAEGRVLMLNQMRYKEDVRDPGQLNLPDSSIKLSESELDMAGKIIDELTTEFAPEDFHDTYTAKVRKLIEKKAEGRTVETEGKQPEKTETDNLMQALKDSLRASKARDRTGKKKKNVGDKEE